MARALELAQAVEGRTSPNPPVGAVLVRDDVVVGEGSTQPPGGPHAEIMAMRAAGELARESTLFVTLEPCSHWGRTPPCADALIRAGVSSVHAAVLDPNPQVRGRGVHRLEAHGVEVELGEFSTEVSELIAAHARYTLSGRPLVTLFQSGPAAALARLVRGTDVVLSDAGPLEPNLVRAIRTADRTPHRRVVRVRRTAVVVSDMRAAPSPASQERRTLPVTLWDWPELLTELGRRETTSVLIVGSGELASSLLGSRLVDRVVASSRTHIPRGFTTRQSINGADSQVVAYREDGER